MSGTSDFMALSSFSTRSVNVVLATDVPCVTDITRHDFELAK
jgi:hypothetical protein